ncbi:hypothetical protein TNCV_1187481 [Trichonephila clavipes]|nr:hypothetical protein TNCV_1187481 [Trichonephila clavipes]
METLAPECTKYQIQDGDGGISCEGSFHVRHIKIHYFYRTILDFYVLLDHHCTPGVPLHDNSFSEVGEVYGRPEHSLSSTLFLPSLKRRYHSKSCVRDNVSLPETCFNISYIFVALFSKPTQNLIFSAQQT